ncbi:MAG: DUF3883 domain-containing protein [Hellea sp.]
MIMLKELRRYDNLGTPTYFWELIQLLKKGEVWRHSDVKSHFYNKIIDGRQIFDGCLPILEVSGIISINEETEEVVLNFGFKDLYSEKMCQSKLLEAFLRKLIDDENFHHIFKQSHYDYLEHKAIIVDGSAFGLQYVNTKRLLTDFGFLIRHPKIQKKFIVSSKWKRIVDTELTPRVRNLMSLEALKEKIKNQEFNGEAAEKYVLEFEEQRLALKDGIQWIAPYDVSAGFDILSFHAKEDAEAKRSIEVKSYVGDTPYFYWTRNEMRVAKEKSDDYFVYLVNRNEMGKGDYQPEMIANPMKNILENKNWTKSVDKYFLSKVSN